MYIRKEIEIFEKRIASGIFFLYNTLYKDTSGAPAGLIFPGAEQRRGSRMVHFSIVFLCMAGLFFCLLSGRFHFLTTLAATAGTYIVSLLFALLRGAVKDPALSELLTCALGAVLFFLSSLALYRNNFLQKFFLALLSFSNFAFLSFFLPLFLGVMPFETAGVFAGICSVFFYLLFTVFLGLCLYRPIRHFSDRGASGFLLGMCAISLVISLFSLGAFDFFFRGNTLAIRLLCVLLLYAALLFSFRSLYQAGRFRAHTAAEAARQNMLEMESGDFADMLTAVREVRAAQKAGEYALDTVSVLLADGYGDKVPEYLSIAKRNLAENPILKEYHENPYLNALIATKAAFAAQNQIHFECNAGAIELPISTAEVCVLANELLTRACLDCLTYDGQRNLRFTITGADHSLRLEAVYTALPPKEEKFTLKGKRAEDVLSRLFEDAQPEEKELHGLENTREIVSRYNGKITVAAGTEEMILQAALKL